VKKKAKFILFYWVFIAYSLCFALDSSTNRIRLVFHNRSKPGKIFVKPYHASTLILPCAAEDFLVGKPNGFEFVINSKDPKRLELNLTSEAQTSNVIVYCQSGLYFVFDYLVQTQVHNDVVEVARHFGGPEVEMNPFKYQDYGSLRKVKLDIKNKSESDDEEKETMTARNKKKYLMTDAEFIALYKKANHHIEKSKMEVTK
jgi:hypothetical protein